VTTCGCGCNQQFLGRAERKPINGLYFLDSEHYGRYLKEQYLISCTGELLPIVREFLEGFAALHYGEHYTLRSGIGTFFQYLKIEGINSLEDVTPKTVTAYLAWAKKNDYRTAAKKISFVSTFFKWAIASGYRKYGNPVVPLIHRPRQQWRMPRPLDNEQLDYTWDLLNKRGNARLRLAAAIAEEAGLRIGEICRLRLQDVDLTRQRLFVRLPNKGKRERYGFFSGKVKQYYVEWMAERNPRNSNDDRLLHNTRGLPCKVQALGKEFSRVLCKTSEGKQRNEEGWDKWSTHALRHTMASNLVSAGADAATVMAAGGWKTYEAMCNYARVDAEVASRGYEEAMKRVQEKKHQVPRKKPLSVSEFLERKHKKA
jgi:integrase/recombinase XerC